MRLADADSLVELASGVDAFYLSGVGSLPALLVEDLEKARSEARETGSDSSFHVGEQRFSVPGRGLLKYPYRLDHPRGVIALTTSTALPTVRVQPRASFLHAVGAEPAIQWFRETVESFVGCVEWKASRVDLFMDSQGWDLRSEDRSRFVCRAQKRVTYEDEDIWRTLMFGTRKSGVLARIYDKSEESATKGTDWWPARWGESYVPDKRVVRVEFQVQRELLRQTSLDTPDDVMNRLPELWAYLTDRWLTYRSPTEDATRSRWPLSPEWRQVQAATLRGEAIGLDRVYAGETAGSVRRLLPALRGYLSSAGALLGATTLDETLHRVGRHLLLDEEESGIPFSARLSEKRLTLGLA
jgi:hypothetical protein